MNFQRGQDPLTSLAIGRESILKEINGKIMNKEEAKRYKANPVWHLSGLSAGTGEYNVIIVVENGKYEVIKNSIRDDEYIPVGNVPYTLAKGDESDLFDLLKKLLENFRKYGINGIFGFPSMQRVAARTIGVDLVSVQPMSAPIGNIMYSDYQYGKAQKNRFKKPKK